jgi:flagellin-like hook-associated protein FlgL
VARIGAFISGTELVLLNRLAKANAQADLATLRLATQRRINAPSDDPSTFVALAGLQNRLNVVTATMANATAASSMVSQAQSAIGQVRTQLDAIRTELLKDEDGTLTPEARAASQAVIDTAIRQIGELAGTMVDGRRLLDGSVDYHLDGRNPAQIFEVRVDSKADGSSPAISGEVLQAATQAEFEYTGTAGPTSYVVYDAVFTLTGKRGSATITVDDSQTLAEAAATINRHSHQTGVTATVEGSTLTLTSVDYGSTAVISIEVVSGQFDVAGTGTALDAEAVINGRTLTGDGNRFEIADDGLHATVEFQPGFTGHFDTMTVWGDALTFSLSTSLSRRATLAIRGLQAARLGGISGSLDEIASGGAYAGLGDNTSRALRIVDEAIGQLDLIDGAVDGFYDAAIASTSTLLGELQSDLNDAITQTDDYDEDEQMLLLAKYEDMASNARAGLAILAQQRSGIVTLIQKLAGLI